MCFSILLMAVCVSRLIAADADINELLVTPVQYVSDGDIVQLRCEINVTTDQSKMLLDNLKILWYDGGFIPIPAIDNVYEMNGYQVRQAIINSSLTGWLQYGRYVCKMEDSNGTITMKSTAVIPEGMQEEDIFRSVTIKRPGVVTLSCPIGSSDEVYWDKLSLDGSEQSSYLRGSSFIYNLSSYDQSAKFACYSNHLHSIIYVHPKDYDPVKFIYPKGNVTLVFNDLESKLIECSTTGSVKPNMTWIHGNINPLGRKRIFTVDASSPDRPQLYVLQLIMNSLVPYVDAGEYTCVVENEWETVNKSVTIVFKLLEGNPFHITTFPAVQYMFEGIDFTSRCVIQVDPNRNNHAMINPSLFFYNSTCDNVVPGHTPTFLQSDGSTVEVEVNEQYDDNGDTWVIAEFTIFKTTDFNIGCYYCYAASFDHTDSSFSDVTYYYEIPFNITSYEPAITAVERGSNVTLSCEVTVYEDYDMNLLYVYYRYYVTTGVDKFVRYNPDINMDTENMTITAKLTIELVDIQHIGLYECYARSIPADYYTDSDDEYYEVGQNITLNITTAEPEPADISDDGKDKNVMIVVLVTLVTVVIGTTLLILIVIIYIKKRRSLKLNRSTQYNEYCEEPTTISAVNKVATQPDVVYDITPKSSSYYPAHQNI